MRMMLKKKVVVLTGAGISAESGLQTFRGLDGLWEGYKVEDVASPEGFRQDPEMVLKFYNQRRSACIVAKPNAAHLALVDLESKFEVSIITQNIDDLHERAGSKRILHLHGEIRKAQSTLYPEDVYPINGCTLHIGDRCPRGAQLRPHVVWFGEPVPNMNKAYMLTQEADVLIVIGTSLQVYPAANLIHEIKSTCRTYVLDPSADSLRLKKDVVIMAEKATVAVPKLVKDLLD